MFFKLHFRMSVYVCVRVFADSDIYTCVNAF